MELTASSIPIAPRRRRWGRDVLWCLLLSALLAVLVQLAVPRYLIAGTSMSPTLRDGQLLLVNRTSVMHLTLDRHWPSGQAGGQPDIWRVYPLGEPARGDIVVFGGPIAPAEPFVKRVVALPGEHVSFAGGSLLINGVPVAEPYASSHRTFCRELPYCALTVPAGMVFVLGDNRTESADSRQFGPVPVDSIIGEAMVAAPGQAQVDALLGLIAHR